MESTKTRIISNIFPMSKVVDYRKMRKWQIIAFLFLKTFTHLYDKRIDKKRINAKDELNFKQKFTHYCNCEQIPLLILKNTELCLSFAFSKLTVYSAVKRRHDPSKLNKAQNLLNPGFKQPWLLRASSNSSNK